VGSYREDPIHPKVTLIGRHYIQFCLLGLIFFFEFLGTCKYTIFMEIPYFIENEEQH